MLRQPKELKSNSSAHGTGTWLANAQNCTYSNQVALGLQLRT